MTRKTVDAKELSVLADVARAALDVLRETVQNHDLEDQSGGLGRQYGSLKRLRDHLTRHAGEDGGGPVELDLPEEDWNLLATCLVHSLPPIDQRLAQDDCPAGERPELEGDRDARLALVKSVVTEPLQPLVGHTFLNMKTSSVVACISFAKSSDASAPSFSEQGARSEEDPAQDSEKEKEAETGSDQEEPEGLFRRREPYLFSPELVRDQRLRTQMRLTLNDLSRAKQRKNLRQTLVFLGALLEGVILDHCLKRREELCLEDLPPDRWDYRELAERVLDEMTDRQRDLIGLLTISSKLLSPAHMYVKPRFIVTSPMVKDAEAMLHWVLSRLGYEGAMPETPRIGTGQAITSIWRSSR